MIAAMTLSIFFVVGDGEKEYPMQYQRDGFGPKACEEFAADLNRARGLIMKPEGGDTGMAMYVVARCIDPATSVM